MSSEDVRLLEHAQAVLDGVVRIPGMQTPRAAAWLARGTLETYVVDVLSARGIESRDASMRSRLCCLRVLEPEIADGAEIAWWGLSRCCHHHAFELAPSGMEVAHLLAIVRRLCGAAK
jgi:hypothetical protein